MQDQERKSENILSILGSLKSMNGSVGRDTRGLDLGPNCFSCMQGMSNLKYENSHFGVWTKFGSIKDHVTLKSSWQIRSWQIRWRHTGDREALEPL